MIRGDPGWSTSISATRKGAGDVGRHGQGVKEIPTRLDRWGDPSREKGKGKKPGTTCPRRCCPRNVGTPGGAGSESCPQARTATVESPPPPPPPEGLAPGRVTTPQAVLGQVGPAPGPKEPALAKLWQEGSHLPHEESQAPTP